MMKVEGHDEKLRNAKLLLGLRLQESMKKKLTPSWGKDTGELKSNIKFEINADGDLVFEMPIQGKFIEHGTPPHIIEAKNAKALHWKSGGEDRFAKKVNHPGTPPFPFIRNTFRNELKKEIIDTFNKAFR